MSLPLGALVDPIVNADWLHEAIKNNKVRVLDVAYKQGKQFDPKKFRETFYGKFAVLKSTLANVDYTKTHIPGSVHFHLDIAQFPGETQRSSLYSPRLFEQYVRGLGVCEGDHIVVVGRGASGGLRFAARVWWLFKTYGHENISVLDGGLESWITAGYPVDDEFVDRGNWTAKDIDPARLVTFDDLDFLHLDEINYLDARPTKEFDGTCPLLVTSTKPLLGAHVKGAKNVPVMSLVDSQGHLANAEKIQEALSKANFDSSKPIVTACNGAIQASLLVLALSRAGYDNARLYNGSLHELAQVAPDLINEK